MAWLRPETPRASWSQDADEKGVIHLSSAEIRPGSSYFGGGAARD
jgi:hypothetical protein